MIYETNSLSDTLKLGREFARQVQPGDVCALIGGLGAGKTAFVQGVQKGLGLPNRSAARRLQSCRYTRAGGCRCTISMYTGLPPSKKWMKSGMKTAFTAAV